MRYSQTPNRPIKGVMAEYLIFSWLTFVLGYLIGDVFGSSRFPSADPGEGAARACGETFALCRCGLDCSGQWPEWCETCKKRLPEGWEPPKSEAVPLPQPAQPVVCPESVGLWNVDMWEPPTCAKCGKGL